MGLDQYNKKRNFAVTPEPPGVATRAQGHSFVVQEHAASHLHYDFRLEHEGVLKSWAIPKGPSFDPKVKRLAMATEDHPLSYGTFEGTIPQGEYGGGTVLLWDYGSWHPVDDPAEGFRKGRLKFELRGSKLHGRWALVRIGDKGDAHSAGKNDGRQRWLLIKEKDDQARAQGTFDVAAAQPKSVATGRTMDQIAAGKNAARRGPPASKGNAKAARQAPKALDGRAARAPAGRRKPHAASTKAASSTTVVQTTSSAPRSSLPDFLQPQLATLVTEAPSGPTWLHETKFDGFRILCRIDRGDATLFTRTAQDWTTHFPSVATAAAGLPVKTAWLDGEVTVVMPDGRTSFGALQNHATLPKDATLVYFVFDLLYLDGRQLTSLPLEERKRALSALTGGAQAGPLRYADHIEGDGPAVFAKACELGLEGIVSKRRDRPYVAGRSLDWQKTKCGKRQEFVIGGFTEPQGARTGLGALLVGVFEDGKLHYAGKVGTGFSQTTASALRRRLDGLGRATSPFSPAPKPTPKSAHWVAPKLLAEIAFTELTSDGKLRHPSFKGLRDDKPAGEVVREVPVAPAKTRATKAPKMSEGAASVQLTHPERVLYPEDGVSKQDLAAYYQAVGPRMLPHLRGRPLALVRCPRGTAGACFFMKHAPSGTAPTVRRIQLREKKATGAYLVIDDVEGLTALVQMSVLEIHTWGSTEANLEAPDRLVIDLDPGPRVEWDAVVQAAHQVRERIQPLGLTAFVKSTGGKGLHVVVPLTPRATWDQTRAFSEVLAEAMVKDQPDRYTTAMPKAGRENKILLDYLRNQRGSTVVAPFSTRARAGATISVPLHWDELDRASPDRPFTLASVTARLARLTSDPWDAYEASRRALTEIL